MRTIGRTASRERARWEGKDDERTGRSLSAELDKVVPEEECLDSGKGQVGEFGAGIEQSMHALENSQHGQWLGREADIFQHTCKVILMQ